MAYKYPNLAAEMSRAGIDYRTLYDETASRFEKSSETVSNWITGRAGALPTEVAFAIRDKYFPSCSIDYLFNEKPIVTGAVEQ